jgi:hypothetical protein
MAENEGLNVELGNVKHKFFSTPQKKHYAETDFVKKCFHFCLLCFISFEQYTPNYGFGIETEHLFKISINFGDYLKQGDNLLLLLLNSLSL